MTNKNSSLPNSWINLSYSDCINNITLTGKKAKQKELAAEGSYPVVDQGRELIGGYFNDVNRIVNCRLPVVVFGDHTRAVKFIRFPFIPGAEGVIRE